ncbi:MAG TPA: TIGR00730 family Rossman fold protein [Thermoanaerobaculia bacterium]|jgi:hypothetical protein
MQRICVFCGSNRGARAEYADAARVLAAALVRDDLTLVYGGGRVGLMGVIADEVLRLGGRAIGVIPRPLWDREVGHANLTEVRIVETMHERKATMADLSDAFIALPGGLGTLEEIFEIWTWAQLGMHAKPCGFLDVAGYYTPLMQFLDRAVSEAFIRPDMRNATIVEGDPERMLARFREYVPPAVQKWIHRDET